MNRKILLVVGVAVILALFASVGAYRFLSEKSQAAEQARLKTVGIVVAAIDIPLGSTINPNQVVIAAWPKDLHPKDSFGETRGVVGRMARREFLRGEPIVSSKLVPLDKSGAGVLSLKIPPGMRAFSVKVNEVVGVGGFIVPEARVDVVVTTAANSHNQQDQVSKTILENVQVLAAGQAIEQKEDKPVTVNTVTLAVTPEDAERLALASNDGKIQLVLRHYADSDKVMTAGIDKSRLLSSYRNAPISPPAEPVKAVRPKRMAKREASASPPPAPTPKKYTVEVIRGSKRSEEKFE